MSFASEFERKIKSANVTELENLLAQFQHGSPFWQQAFDELQVRKLTEVPNQTSHPTKTPSNNGSNPKSNRLTQIAIDVLIGFLVLALAYIFREHLGIPL